MSSSGAPEGFVFDRFAARSAVSDVLFVRDERGAYVCKRLGDRGRDDAEARSNLEREGRIVRALAGRGAPDFVAAGVDDAGPFVVTRRLDMKPLAELGAREIDARVVERAFYALAEIHEAADANGALGVVHADVSPSNVMVAPDGIDVRFVDFGLSRMRDDAPPMDGAFRGTMAFAPPEAARGEAIDVRSDLFALAASLLSVAAGEPPRSASSEAALLAAAGSEPIDAWARSVAGRIAFGPMLLACVAFAPADRPARAREVCGT
jgi:serine/threonine protein kinase